jgi:hypothetical protein
MKNAQLSIVILAFLSALLIPLIFYENPENKKEFVKNKTVENSGNLIFIYETVRYPTRVKILDKHEKRVGMEADPWNLNFGVLPVGIGGRRFINLANYGKDVIEVRIVVHGNISRMISFDKNYIKLYPGEELKITASLNSSLSKPGNYTGEIDIISKKVRFSFLNPLIEWF